MCFGKYIAHRGLHNEKLWAPENSAEAFRRAAEKGFPIELDVHLTSDNQLAVFHDKNLFRMTGVDKQIAELTMEEIKKLRLHETSEKIPTLYEVLKIIDGRVPLLIEIKSSPIRFGKLEKRILKQMRHYKGKWAVQSFSPLSLWIFKRSAPKIPRGQLITIAEKDDRLSKKLFHYIMKHTWFWKKAVSPSFLSYDLRCVSMDTLMLAISLNCKLFTWTVRSPELLAEAEKFSDSVIFENFIPY